MATDFWSSSHYKRWVVDRATLHQARSDDLQYVDNPEYLGFLNIFFANLISKLGKKLQLRQRVIATATVFFRRFYVKNSYCETDPFIVIAACCYVAAKAEESPVHIKNVVSEARMLFGREEYGIKSFPSDNSKLAEMEFYLVDELECDLTIFHPYRTLMTLCGKEGGAAIPEAEAGEADADDVDGLRYWGTGEGKLELQEGALQMACHSGSPTRRSSRSASHSQKKQHHQQDVISFMAGLNVSMSLVATIAQEIISLHGQVLVRAQGITDEWQQRSSKGQHKVRESFWGHRRWNSSWWGCPWYTRGRHTRNEIITPTLLVQLLLRMREHRMADLAHPASGRPVAVNKMLERTQAAG
uniref:N/A n=1 Tax=Ganoderma boninense TaxID=34458 RepID=A0A5K1K5W8_9APHY|nr:N/A [Ganoderma boninense]